MSLRLFLLFLLLGGTALAGDFPEPYNSEPDKNAQPPEAEEAASLINLPEGFSVSVFASEPEVSNPIAMTWDKKGRLWIAENFTYAERAKRFDLDLRDRLLILEDTDWDGIADKRTVFADDLQMLTSVEVGLGGVWLMCPPQVLFIPDADEDGKADGPPEVILDGFTVAESNYHNFANGLRWGPDGWLYGRCGHSCPGKIGRPWAKDEERIPIEGGIWRYSPEKGHVEVITHGTTNPWGHDWDEHGELFFINTVNGHLWHGIPGAHFKESFGADPNPLVFERLDMHADHWHFDTSGSWSKSRGGTANEYGGGHAHIGMMVYQANQWPDYYRGKLYTLNMHGRRTNVERLEREGSGYMGRHEPDIFVTGDEWFRGIDIRQGPDGSAFILDWSDTGECHESNGVHRASGRIFRISYGTPGKPDFSILENPTEQNIARCITHENVWYARRLQEQFRSGKFSDRRDDLHPLLLSIATDKEMTAAHRLRAFACLHSAYWPFKFPLTDENEHLRAWAIRTMSDPDRGGTYLIDTGSGTRPELSLGKEGIAEIAVPVLKNTFTEKAKTDPSGLVRLTIASALQRLPLDSRASIAKALVAHEEDAADHNLPSIVWYGISPLAKSDPMELVKIARKCTWPDTSRWIARALAMQIEDAPEPVDALLSLAAEQESSREHILQGVSEGLKGWRSAPKPASWDGMVAALPEKPSASLQKLVQELGAVFGDGRALHEIKSVALDSEADQKMRIAALETLIENRPEDLRKVCEQLLEDRLLNATAVKGLALFDDPKLGESIAKQYRRFTNADRPSVIETLVSRPAWAAALLAEMKQGKVPRQDLSAFQARQIRAFHDEALSNQLASVWGEVRESPEANRELIEKWKNQLTPKTIADANLGQGRQLFAGICGACHTMYGEGGKIGPDLTGSGRTNLDYLLENILDPNAVVSADYRMSILTMKDGRVLTGVIAGETGKTLTLRQANGEFSLETSEIESRQVAPVSMMPEGLILAFSDDQVRDLIAYLMHPGQVPLPK